MLGGKKSKLRNSIPDDLFFYNNLTCIAVIWRKLQSRTQ